MLYFVPIRSCRQDASTWGTFNPHQSRTGNSPPTDWSNDSTRVPAHLKASMPSFTPSVSLLLSERPRSAQSLVNKAWSTRASNVSGGLHKTYIHMYEVHTCRRADGREQKGKGDTDIRYFVRILRTCRYSCQVLLLTTTTSAQSHMAVALPRSRHISSAQRSPLQGWSPRPVWDCVCAPRTRLPTCCLYFVAQWQ